MRCGDQVCKISDLDSGILKVYRIFGEQREMFDNGPGMYSILPVEGFTTISAESVSGDDLVLAEEGISEYIKGLEKKIAKAKGLLRR